MIEAVYGLLLERKMLGFREQTLSEEGQIAFARRFGQLIKDEGNRAITYASFHFVYVDHPYRDSK